MRSCWQTSSPHRVYFHYTGGRRKWQFWVYGEIRIGVTKRCWSFPPGFFDPKSRIVELDVVFRTVLQHGSKLQKGMLPPTFFGSRQACCFYIDWLPGPEWYASVSVFSAREGDVKNGEITEENAEVFLSTPFAGKPSCFQNGNNCGGRISIHALREECDFQKLDFFKF